MNTIHIHHVIEWLASELRPVTEEELLSRIATTYGEDIRFTSCTEDQFPKDLSTCHAELSFDSRDIVSAENL